MDFDDRRFTERSDRGLTDPLGALQVPRWRPGVHPQVRYPGRGLTPARTFTPSVGAVPASGYELALALLLLGTLARRLRRRSS